jgi:succinyl-CoA synthetase alpha subunit
MSWAEILPYFEQDAETKMVVGFGEIGTTSEEDAADLIKAGGFTKPFVVYIAGKNAIEGVRFGHAGAMISRGRGTAQTKQRALSEAGAIVVEHFSDIGKVARAILDGEK